MNSVTFQQIETDFYIRTPSDIPTQTSAIDDFNGESTDITSVGATSTGQREAVLRIFGVTEEGNSICAHITGFFTYLYIPAWSGMTQTDIQTFSDTLNEKLINETREKGLQRGVLNITVKKLSSVWGYQYNRLTDFLCIQLALPSLVPPAKRFLEDGILINSFSRRSFQTYESNVPFILRFMVDTKMSGGSWIELPPEKYAIKPNASKMTRSQLEVEIAWSDIIVHESQGQWNKMAPLRVLSFDIECAGRKGHFPTPDMDPVIQIASVVSRSNAIGQPLHKAIHTLNTCSPIPGVEVISNETEHKLLMSWNEHFLDADPDVVIGYNIINFDFPYLIDRAQHLKLPNFAYFGRDLNVKTRVRNTTFSSRAIGKQENKELNIDGRIQFDVLVAVRRDYKLVSYTLNAVSAHFLKQQKEDVHHSIITELQEGNDDTRRRLAEYCVKDAVLPLRLMQKLMFLINYTEMARVTGVPIMFLLQRGQSIKVVSQLLRKARQHHMVVPVMPKQISDDKYEGATVIDPITGYYDVPIATLDFASLYPSIMMAHNLCYTTLISKHEAETNLKPDEYVVTPNNDYFVSSKLRAGLLPEILTELLAARKQAKREMNAAPDGSFEQAVLNGRQLALKISANSVYGFTGAQVGQLPCLAISSSVTSFGREMIEHTRATVEKVYSKSNGFKYDAQVIYGDTDSVMVRFGTDNLEEAMELGRQAAQRVSEEFTNPIKLEFEKVYFPYLLMAKKRYAGLYWTRTDKWDKIDAKGIETVRRDNCLLVRNIITEALDTILVHRSPKLAIENVKQHITSLLNNEVDLSLLIISKSLGKGAEAGDYAAKQAHVELAERMRKRDPLSAPSVGDRVPYVIIRKAKGAPAYEKSEDPLWVLNNHLSIDTDWYLEHQLKKPLERIFEPILGARASDKLFRGDHTLSVKGPVANIGKKGLGGLGSMLKEVPTCLGCRVSLHNPEQSALCPRCEPNRAQIYLDKLNAVREREEHFGALWSQCQRCQGSTLQTVLCQSTDCPIFYRRTKARLDLQSAETMLGLLEPSNLL